MNQKGKRKKGAGKGRERVARQVRERKGKAWEARSISGRLLWVARRKEGCTKEGEEEVVLSPLDLF